MAITLNFTGQRITDPIRNALSSAGASSTDLANYDAAAVGSAIQLTTAQTVAFMQSLRTSFLGISGAYRLNGTDAKFEAAVTTAAGNQIAVSAVSSGGNVENGILTANTIPVLVMIHISGATTNGSGQMRRGTTAAVTGNPITTPVTLGSVATPVLTINNTATGYIAFVIKRPLASTADTVDRNVAFGTTANLSLNSGSRYINNGGWNSTSFNMGNAYNSMWQAIAAPISNW